MIAQPPDDLLDFRCDIFLVFSIHRIATAGKHKILPHHEPKLVANIIESVFLVNAAAPDPNHVHVGVFGHLQQVAIFLFTRARQEVVRGNPVRPLTKHRHVVDLKEE